MNEPVTEAFAELERRSNRIRDLEKQLAAAVETINWAREHRNSQDFYEQLEIKLGRITK